jgi:galactokinase
MDPRRSPALDTATSSAALALYARTFGDAPTVIASAPGRINLLGEHTDYNGGPVLPLAISRRTTIAAGPAKGWDFVSASEGRAAGLDIAAPMGAGWSDYVRAALRELQALGKAPAGARIAVTSTVPVGAGLSSSTALTVAAGAALLELGGGALDLQAQIALAYRAEHDQVGVRGGRMDQTISVLGRKGYAMLYETGTGEITMVPMPAPVYVAETGVEHQLAGGSLNARRHECEQALAMLQRRWPQLGALAAIPRSDLAEVESLLDDPFRRRVRHVVTETERTREAAAALAAGDLERVGQLLVEGQASLAQDYESSVEEAEVLVRSAVEHGALGARLTGAGWGGAVLVLAPAGVGEGERIMQAVADAFESRFGRRPATWRTRASDGLRLESLPHG